MAIFDKFQISKQDEIHLETIGEKLLMKPKIQTLKLLEKIKNMDGAACADFLAIRGQKFDQNCPLCCESIDSFFYTFLLVVYSIKWSM